MSPVCPPGRVAGAPGPSYPHSTDSAVIGECSPTQAAIANIVNRRHAGFNPAILITSLLFQVQSGSVCAFCAVLDPCSQPTVGPPVLAAW